MIPDTKKRVALTLTPDEHDLLTTLARESFVKPSQLARAALFIWLQHGVRSRIETDARLLEEAAPRILKRAGRDGVLQAARCPHTRELPL